MVYELSSKFDARASFYGKAQVKDEGDTKTLLSYGTPIVQITNGEVKSLFDHNVTNTTGRHVKEFLLQNGIDYDAIPGKSAGEKLQNLESINVPNCSSVYELKPEYSARDSFHGKALVEVNDDKTTLLSYGTPIMGIKDDCLFRIADDSVVSNTTASHIKEFIQQNDFELDDIDGKSIKEKLMNLPTERELDLALSEPSELSYVDDIVRDAGDRQDDENKDVKSKSREEDLVV